MKIAKGLSGVERMTWKSISHTLNYWYIKIYKITVVCPACLFWNEVCHVYGGGS